MVVVISVVVFLQVDELKSKMSYSFNIGQLKMMFSEQNLVGIIQSCMNLGVINPTISNEYLPTLQFKLEEISVTFHDEHVNNLSLFQDLQQQEGNIFQNILEFSYGESYTIRTNRLEFQYDILNSLLRVSQSQQLYKQLSLYFLNANYLEYSNLLYSFHNIIANDLEDTHSSLNYSYTAFGSATIGIFVTFLMLGVYFLIILNNYKKKLLLLLTRLTTSDVECELYILQTCVNQLKDSKMQWMQIPFASFIATLHENFQNQVLQIESKKKQHPKNGKNYSTSILGSWLQGQQLNQYKTYLLVLTVISMGGIFFMAILLLAYQSSLNITPIISLLNQSSDLYQSFNSALAVNEILTDSELLILSDPDYPPPDKERSTKILISSISIVQKFSQEFPQNLSKLDSSLDSKKIQLSNLFSKDICLEFSTEYVCNPENQGILTEEQTIIRTILKAGISGLLSSYLQLFLSAQGILSESDPVIRQQDLNFFMNSSSNLALSLQAYDTPMKAMTIFFQEVHDCAVQQADDISYLTFIYYIIFGVLLVFLQLIIDWKIKQWLSHSIQLLNLSLSFIPVQVTQNEAYQQILKSICRVL